MTRGEKQRLFVMLLGQLYLWAYSKGKAFSLGESYRSDEQAEINAIGAVGRAQVAAILKNYNFLWLADKIENNKGNGIRNTLHEMRLAQDLNLFINGIYTDKYADYQEVGEYWKSLHPLCRWGGDFRNKLGALAPDIFHFSLEHDGIK